MNENYDEKESNVDDINLATQLKPSAISISFRLEKTKNLNFRIFFGTYQKLKNLNSKLYKIKRENHVEFNIVDRIYGGNFINKY